MQVQTQTDNTSQILEDAMTHLGSGGVMGDFAGLDARDYEAVYTLGHNFYAQGKYLEAMRIFSYLVTNNHLERRFVNAFASSLHMVGGYKEAINYYGIAYAMDPRDSAPTFHSCECLIAMGLKAEAKEGLGLIIRRCTAPEQSEIRERSQALLALLNRPQAK
jgi:type III secretion system low calcium response chaperone LcrH/SycD